MVAETESFIHAKETAIEKAKIQILADTFGTAINMSASTSITGNGTQMHALSQSQVKGEWIETLGEPIITKLFEDGQLALKVEIRGRVRALTRTSTDFIAKVLCGAPDPRYEKSTFKSGDSMFLYFQAPGDGYLAVYLYDGDDSVFCLLPYQGQGNGIFEVKGGRQYILFSADYYDSQTPQNVVDEYTLQTSSALEINKIYVIYSPNRFTKANDTIVQKGLPRELSFEDFQKWLSRICIEDQFAGVKSVDITIESK